VRHFLKISLWFDLIILLTAIRIRVRLVATAGHGLQGGSLASIAYLA
jgi:hypothetical protein